MEQAYHVASLKHNAWWSVGNQWHSDLSEAKTMGRSEAIAFAKKQSYSRAIPVAVDDMNEVKG